MLLRTTFITISILTICNGLLLNCIYSIRTNWNIPDIYSCTARIIFVGDYRNVIDVSLNHLDGFNHADVKGLILENQILNFVPRNIHSFFPNLESYDLSSSAVEELTSEDLTGFYELRQFRFDGNNLRIIESNLFNENSLLTWISFDGNPVRHFAHHVFDHLQLLHSLSINGHADACINETASNSRIDVVLLILRLRVNCPPNFEMTEKKIVTAQLINKLNSGWIQ